MYVRTYDLFGGSFIRKDIPLGILEIRVLSVCVQIKMKYLDGRECIRSVCVSTYARI